MALLRKEAQSLENAIKEAQKIGRAVRAYKQVEANTTVQRKSTGRNRNDRLDLQAAAARSQSAQLRC